MRTFFLTTKRLGFSKWCEDDLRLAMGLWGDYEVTKLIDARGELSEEQVKARLLKEIDSNNTYGIQYWPIFLLESGEHVGCCGLRPYDLTKSIYEIGFHIKKDFWGQGVAYEAAGAVIKFAFEEIDAMGLFAGHNPKNSVSKNLLEKLGFHYTHDEFYPPTGLQHPSYLLEKHLIIDSK